MGRFVDVRCGHHRLCPSVEAAVNEPTEVVNTTFGAVEAERHVPGARKGCAEAFRAIVVSHREAAPGLIEGSSPTSRWDHGG